MKSKHTRSRCRCGSCVLSRLNLVPDGPRSAVEIIDNHDGTYSVRVYDAIVFTGAQSECEQRAAQE